MSKCVTPLQRHLWPQSVNSIEELCIKRLSNQNVILSKEIQGVQSILSINYCISISLLMNTVWSVNDGTAETRLKPAGNLPWWVSGKMEALYKANCPSSCHAGVHCSIIDGPHAMYRMVGQWCDGDPTLLVSGKIYQFKCISSLYQVFFSNKFQYIIDEHTVDGRIYTRLYWGMVWLYS